MVKTRIFHVLTLAGTLALLIQPAKAETESSAFDQSEKTQILGRETGARFFAGVPADSQRVQSTSSLKILGNLVEALQALMIIPVIPDGPAYAEFYSFGKRVFSQTAYFTHNGILQATAGLAPAEVRVPFIVYPVGPMVLQIDGGVRFQADIEGKIMPTFMIPLTLSVAEVQLQGNATGTGFIEGYASIWALRGGVGGQLDLIDGQADVHAQFFFDGRKPGTMVSGMVEFLKGRIYAFIDYFNIFKWGWSHLWNHDFYKWNGYCYSAGNLQCPAP